MRLNPFAILLASFPCLGPGCARFVPRETAITPANAEFDLEYIRTPFSRTGIPVLSLRNGEHGVSRFIIDTGSEGTVISERYASQRGFPSRFTVPYRVVGAQNERSDVQGVVRIDELRLETSRSPGSVAFRQFDAVVARTPLFDQGVAGILGAPLLANCTFTIDFGANVLLLEDGSLDRDLSPTVTIQVTWGGLIYLEIEVAGETQWALLDTGSNLFLSVPEKRWDALQLKDWIVEGHSSGFSFGGKSRSRFGQLNGSIVIAGQRIEDPFVTSSPGGVPAIGGGLLKGYALSIDQRSRIARLVPSPRDAQAKPPMSAR